MPVAPGTLPEEISCSGLKTRLHEELKMVAEEQFPAGRNWQSSKLRARLWQAKFWKAPRRQSDLNARIRFLAKVRDGILLVLAPQNCNEIEIWIYPLKRARRWLVR